MDVESRETLDAIVAEAKKAGGDLITQAKGDIEAAGGALITQVKDEISPAIVASGKSVIDMFFERLEGYEITITLQRKGVKK